jgi:cyclophilin family peptidyl-prolyl cis-trans isomerase
MLTKAGPKGYCLIMKNTTINLVAGISVFALCIVTLGAASCGGSSHPSTKRWSSPPAMQIDTSKTYYAVFNTSMGNFKIKLFAVEAPKTVNNFVFLARQKYYDGIVFHRIIKAFMIQGGDPLGTGMGGPGYQFADELPVKHPYDVGIVAMANAGPNTNGSQFFICTGTDAASLNKAPNYTQFGQVVEGMDVVQKIAAVPTTQGSDYAMSKPINPPIINRITIEES